MDTQLMPGKQTPSMSLEHQAAPRKEEGTPEWMGGTGRTAASVVPGAEGERLGKSRSLLGVRSWRWTEQQEGREGCQGWGRVVAGLRRTRAVWGSVVRGLAGLGGLMKKQPWRKGWGWGPVAGHRYWPRTPAADMTCVSAGGGGEEGP